MKKILIFIITFIFMTHVSAYDSNVAGVIVKPSVSTSVTDKSCPTGAYYLAGQKSYMLGLRISFYDNTGKQIGKTIDVWLQRSLVCLGGSLSDRSRHLAALSGGVGSADVYADVFCAVRFL